MTKKHQNKQIVKIKKIIQFRAYDFAKLDIYVPKYPGNNLTVTTITIYAVFLFVLRFQTRLRTLGRDTENNKTCIVCNGYSIRRRYSIRWLI